MSHTSYATSNIDKGLALVAALIAAGHHTHMTTASHSVSGGPSHIVLTTHASAEQFAAVRMGLADRFPSSNSGGMLDMPNPDNVVIPDTMPAEWAPPAGWTPENGWTDESA